MIGKIIFHYKIVEEIGRGGMAIVYKAEDTILERFVAMKFLSLEFTKDKAAKKRFVLEAQAVSALDHPNIYSIHEIGETDDGQPFIVMTYYPGETLKEKINIELMDIMEVLEIALQSAEGLARAHRAGITHRDIKPANIMFSEDGNVKIVDFGLAKITGKTALTKTGTTLGTVQYMSPEQAQGKNVDHRTDIFSFGALIYEMLTGQYPFKGEYEQAIVYSILSEEPEPVTALRSGIPMQLEGVIKKAMAKNVTDRYQHMEDLQVDLRSIKNDLMESKKTVSYPSFKTSITQTNKQRKVFSLNIVIIITVLTALVIGWSVWKITDSSPSSIEQSKISSRLSIKLPDSTPLALSKSMPLGVGRPSLSLSPDGSQLVYVADVNNTTSLYLRQLDKFETKLLQGTEGGFNPFFSPDGQWIAFFTESKIKKVSLTGGPVTTLGEARNPYGGDWGQDGMIYFTQGEGNRLTRIPVNGGTPEDIFQGNFLAFWPQLLPDGNTLLLSNPIRVVSLSENEEDVFPLHGIYARYLPSGHMIFSQKGTILAVPFNLNTLKVGGTPVPVIDGILLESSSAAPQYTFSPKGSLIYMPGISEQSRSFVWVDYNGLFEPLTLPKQSYGTFKLSPDGKKLAVQVIGVNDDIWIFDLERGTPFRLTFEGNNGVPVWTPNNNAIIFTSDKTGAYNLYRILLDSSDSMEQITTSRYYQEPYSITSDGKLLAIGEFHPETKMDIWIIALDSLSEPQIFINTQFNEWGPMFSPNGKWIAYTSDESGRYEVYIQSYPGPGGKQQISTKGGEEPVWSPDGTELYYRNGQKWMRVKVFESNDALNLDKPQLFFEGPFMNVQGFSYDIAPDNKRFLMLIPEQDKTPVTELKVVLNWFEELNKQVPIN